MIPDQPSSTSTFPPQHGYADIDVKTHSYSDKPTPLKSDQSKFSEFIADKTNKEHQKKYAKEGGKRLFNFLLRTVCK